MSYLYSSLPKRQINNISVIKSAKYSHLFWLQFVTICVLRIKVYKGTYASVLLFILKKGFIKMSANTPSVPFIDLKAQQARIRPQIDEAIRRVLDSGQYIMGPAVEELETKLAEYTGAKYALTCSSGTSALVLAMMVLGVRPGDAVFVPSFTFIATAEAVLLAGGIPVIVDVEEGTFNMDVNDLRQAVSKAKKDGLNPKIVVPVDLFGCPANYAEIAEVAAENDMHIVGDGCQSFGASLDGKKVGSLAAITATSFFPAKPLGCYGDGGALFTDNPEYFELMKSFRVHGMGADRYENVRIGINGRLDTMQAAILLIKMSILEEELAQRDKIATRYREGIKKVQHQIIPSSVRSAWAQYSFLLPGTGANRGEIQAFLKAKGIPSMVYYPIPIHRQGAYASYAEGRVFPVSDMLAERIVSVPMHPYLAEETQNYIIETLNEALANA